MELQRRQPAFDLSLVLPAVAIRLLVIDPVERKVPILENMSNEWHYKSVGEIPTVKSLIKVLIMNTEIL